MSPLPAIFRPGRPRVGRSAGLEARAQVARGDPGRKGAGRGASGELRQRAVSSAKTRSSVDSSEARGGDRARSSIGLFGGVRRCLRRAHRGVVGRAGQTTRAMTPLSRQGRERAPMSGARGLAPAHERVGAALGAVQSHDLAPPPLAGGQRSRATRLVSRSRSGGSRDDHSAIRANKIGRACHTRFPPPLLPSGSGGFTARCRQTHTTTTSAPLPRPAGPV